MLYFLFVPGQGIRLSETDESMRVIYRLTVYRLYGNGAWLPQDLTLAKIQNIKVIPGSIH